MEFKQKEVVTCFLRNRGEVLLLRRSEKVGSYRGRWGAVSGHLEGTPEQTAITEIAEETGLAEAVSLAQQGEPFAVEDRQLSTRWVIHPFLFDCAHRNLRLDWETTEAVWVPPVEILRYDTVPQLWKSYAQVAPTLEWLRRDRTHGSAYLSYRALEVLRDCAGWLQHKDDNTTAQWTALCELARNLAAVRQSMTVIGNRINRAMHASRDNPSARNVADVVHETLLRAIKADQGAARRAAQQVAGRRVFTLSRSGTLLETLECADPPPTTIIVAESRPGGEGAGVARQLIRTGFCVTLIPDSQISQTFQERKVDVALVGADAVLPSGGIINKIGTLSAALAASYFETPFYVVTAVDKCTTREDIELEMLESSGGAAAVDSIDRTGSLFERIPSELITALLTERGTLSPGELDGLMKELEKNSRW